MDRFELLYRARAQKRQEAHELADEYAKEIAREIDAGRLTNIAVAKRLGISPPAVARAVRQGRELLAQCTEGASDEAAKAA